MKLQNKLKKEKSKLKTKKNMCSIWNINRRNIYYNLLGSRKGLKIEQAEIKLVKKIYENSFKIYGYKKCSKVASLSEWKVHQIYKILNISSMRQAKQRKPKEIKVTNEKFSNIVSRNFRPLTLNKFWRTDVSYIKINKN